MRIDITNTVFFIAGGFVSYRSKGYVRELLEQGGGGVARTFNRKVGALVLGDNDHNSMTEYEAQTRGVPILRERELGELLEHGVVEIGFETPSAPGGDSAFDELLGETRSVLALPPTAERWGELVELIDRCEPARLDVLVDYISDHVDSWSARTQLLCAPPNSWIVAMARGEDSPAFRLLRRMDLSMSEVNTTGFKKIVALESLEHVRWLDMSSRKALTKTAFRALAKSPMASNLEHLMLGDIDFEQANVLGGVDTLASLRSVGALSVYDFAPEHVGFGDFFRSTCAANVERLALRSFGFDAILPYIEDPTALPSLCHIEVDTTDFDSEDNYDPVSLLPLRSYMEASMSEQARSRVRVFTVRMCTKPKQGTLIDVCALGALHTLELYLDETGRGAEDAAAIWERTYRPENMNLPASVERVHVDVELSAEARAHIERARPGVEVVYLPRG